MVVLFRAAIPSLEHRSFAVWDPTSVDYESTSSTLIASHYPGLWRDLERLNDLVSICRNVLTIGEQAQDLAAECVFEQEIFRLINCCVRVTARGYDGDAGTGDEDRWQWVVSAYKKLLITSLQFLNNLVARNERRKLMLWVSLFDTSVEGLLGEAEDDRPAPLLRMPEPPVSTSDILVALGENSQAKVDATADALRAKRLLAPKDQATAASRPVSGYVLYVKYHTNLVREKLGPSATPGEVAKELSMAWSMIPEQDRKVWNTRYDELMGQYEKDLATYNEVRKSFQAEKASSDKAHADNVASRIAQIDDRLIDRFSNVQIARPEPLTHDTNSFRLPERRPYETGSDAYHMQFSAAEGSRVLGEGKEELLKRLEGYSPAHEEQLEFASPTSPEMEPSPASPTLHEDDPEMVDDLARVESDEIDDHESEEEDDQYSGSTEDGRGLLTDVPLILGPSEIEVLPMIVMSGIVPPPLKTSDLNADEAIAIMNMHTVRCHLLLAQDNGKNLLRELLIFVAAWDLREEELYFKFMVKIMEAILVNGLMPYAYHAFRE